MSDERRSAHRYAVWFPMRIETGGDAILSISRDISESGVLVVAAARPEVGATVEVTLALPNDEAGERVVAGRIVRVAENEDDQDGLWRYRVAVCFDENIPALEPLLEQVERDSQLPQP